MENQTDNKTLKRILTTAITLLGVLLIPTGCADSLLNPGLNSNRPGNSQPPTDFDPGLVKVTITGIGTHNMSASATAYIGNMAMNLSRPSNAANKAVSLDGVDDVVYIDGDLLTDLNTADGNPNDKDPYTVEGWVYPKAVSGSGENIFAFEAGSSVVYNPASDKFVYDDGTIKKSSQHTFAPNTWYHVALTVDASGNGVLYVNGQKEIDFTTTVFLGPGSDAAIGISVYGYDNFTGRIDEVRVWNTARSKSEINAVMDQTIHVSDHLIGYYRFNDTRTDDKGNIWVDDPAGNNNAIELRNGASLTSNAAPITTPQAGNGSIQMKPVNHGSFIMGDRAGGGFRYVWATFKVRNAEADGSYYNSPRQNLTFMAADNNATIAHTAILEMHLFNGEPITGSAAEQIAKNILPTGRVMSIGGELEIAKAGALQLFTENEAASINSPSGVDIFPYGFITRSPDVTPASRKIPANPAPHQYDGVVAFAFKIPLQAQPKQDPYKVSALFLPVDDSQTRITQSPESDNPHMIGRRASYLDASVVTVLPGSSYRGMRRLLCNPRVAGTTSNPVTLFSELPHITSMSPALSPINAMVDFTFGFSQPISAANINAHTFVVHGRQSGTQFIGQTYNGAGTSTITTPVTTFFPGEVVEVSITSGLGICPGEVYRYRVDVMAGNGTLGTPVSLSNISASVALGDVNSDGNLDIVTANTNFDQVFVLLGDGTGSFTQTAESPIGVGSKPASVALGDVDGDGDLDIVTANRGSDNVSVLHGIGNGEFIFDQNYAVGNEPQDVALGDLNADGDLDLVVANNLSDDATILFNSGSGEFPSSRTLNDAGLYPESVVLSDVNSDGTLDIIIGDSPVVFLGNGAGGFTKFGSVSVNGMANAMAVGDLNGDGIPDIATANYNSNDIKVFFGNGDGTFTRSSGGPYGIGDAPASIVLGDLNADGALDIVTSGSPNEMHVLINKGSGLFKTPVSYTGLSSDALVMGDINNDGDLDVIIDSYLLPGQQ